MLGDLLLLHLQELAATLKRSAQLPAATAQALQKSLQLALELAPSGR
jgi:hypothetical protein